MANREEFAHQQFLDRLRGKGQYPGVDYDVNAYYEESSDFTPEIISTDMAIKFAILLNEQIRVFKHFGLDTKDLKETVMAEFE